MAAIFDSGAGASKFYQIGAATVSFGGTSNAIFLNVTIQVQRQLNPVYTLGKGILWSAIPTSGTVTAQSVISNDGDIVGLLEGKACEPKPITIMLGDGACAGASVSKTFNIEDAYFNQATFTANAQQGYVAADVSAQFTKISIS